MPPDLTLSDADLELLASELYRFAPTAVRVCLEKPPPADFEKYRGGFPGFCRDVLHVNLTPEQAAIGSDLPGRVKVNSGHGVGKTFVCACIFLWWLYTRPRSVVITTAPTERDVVDLLWTEIRLLHARAKVLPDYFIGPKAAECFHHEEHWAKGYTARKGESLQGRHRESMLFIFDECEGVDPVYWHVTNTMFQPGQDHGWVAIGNPTTTSSQSYLEDLARGPDGRPKWKLHTLSALDHPNIRAQLAGRPPPIPNAVTLDQVQQYLADWTDPVPPDDRQPGDLEWPPESGQFYRPGPSFLSRVTGRRPDQGVDTVWSGAAFEKMLSTKIPVLDKLERAWGERRIPTIGVDPAAFGDDDTGIHGRIGPVSIHHEAHNGWGPERTAPRVKELCAYLAEKYNALAVAPRPPLKAEDVRVVIEGDGGFGVGVFSHRGLFRRWTLASAGSVPTITGPRGEPIYPNLRSQWWCESAETARKGGLDITLLPQDVIARLRVQLLAPAYKILNRVRHVESKKDIKGRLMRSPDDADAFIISLHQADVFLPGVLSADDD